MVNPYELADFIETGGENIDRKELVNMLRQQADRIAELEKLLEHSVGSDCREMRYIQEIENKDAQIAELEKQLDTRTRELIGASFYEHDYKTLMANSEPVAWVYETKNVDGEPYLTNVSLKPLFGLVTRYGYKEIPLYTTPQIKPLSDEEIWSFADMVLENSDVIGFARAIEERHGIK